MPRFSYGARVAHSLKIFFELATLGCLSCYKRFKGNLQRYEFNSSLNLLPEIVPFCHIPVQNECPHSICFWSPFYFVAMLTHPFYNWSSSEPLKAFHHLCKLIFKLAVDRVELHIESIFQFTFDFFSFFVCPSHKDDFLVAVFHKASLLIFYCTYNYTILCK